MTRTVVAGLAALLVFVDASSACPADLAGARAFIASLYAHYPAPKGAPGFDPTGKAAARVFDPPMIALLRNNDRLTPPGDVGAIDSDVLCDCQDDDGLRAIIGPIVAVGANDLIATVVLHFTKATPPETRRLKLDLVQVAGRWRIHDIDDGDVPSLRAYLIQANRDATRAP